MDEAIKKLEDYLLSDEFKTIVENSLKNITQNYFEQLSRQQTELAKTFDIKSQEWSEDRKNISDNTILLKTVLAVLQELHETNNSQTKKLVKKIGETLSPLPEAISEATKITLNEQLENKKVIKVSRKSLFARARGLLYGR